MRRLVVLVATFGMFVTACTAGGGSNATPSVVNTASGATHAPVTIQLWSFYSGREFKQYDAVLSDFQKLYPWITINHTPAKSDQEILRAVNSGTAPDLGLTAGPDNVAKFCSSGALRGPHAVPAGGQHGHHDHRPEARPAVHETTRGRPVRAPGASPTRTGLYYNLDMFQKGRHLRAA